MQAIDIVTTDDLMTNQQQIVGRCRQSRVKIVHVCMFAQQLRMRLQQATATHLLRHHLLEGGNRHDPRMQLHTASMSFLNGKAKRVIARIAVESTRQGNVPRLNG